MNAVVSSISQLLPAEILDTDPERIALYSQDVFTIGPPIGAIVRPRCMALTSVPSSLGWPQAVSRPLVNMAQRGCTPRRRQLQTRRREEPRQAGAN